MLEFFNTDGSCDMPDLLRQFVPSDEDGAGASDSVDLNMDGLENDDQVTATVLIQRAIKTVDSFLYDQVH
jgi:hypothetical protein